MLSVWFPSIITSRLTVANPLCIVNNFFEDAPVDSLSCQRLQNRSAHLPLKTCHRAQQLQCYPCSLTRKGIISHLIKYLWMHLLFIYFDQCLPFHAAVVLYAGAPQIASVVDIMGLQSQLTLRKSWVYSVNLKCNCNLKQNGIAFSPSYASLLCCIHQGWRNYPLCG